jgi:hypothetical protein
MSGYSGIAPVKQASGKSVWIHMCWARPKFLRQTFHEMARTSLRFLPQMSSPTECCSGLTGFTQFCLRAIVFHASAIASAGSGSLHPV